MNGQGLLGVLFILVLLPLKTSFAQELPQPRNRQGYFLSAGLSGATMASYDDDALHSRSGGVLGLRCGELLTPRLGLGLSLDFGSLSSSAGKAMLIGVSVEGQWEFTPLISLRSGFGLGVIGVDKRVEDENEPGRMRSSLDGSVGTQYFLGLAYDWFISEKKSSGGLALTPGLTLYAFPGDSFAAFYLFVGVELTKWTGLPRNQLELPENEAY